MGVMGAATTFYAAFSDHATANAETTGASAPQNHHLRIHQVADRRP